MALRRPRRRERRSAPRKGLAGKQGFEPYDGVFLSWSWRWVDEVLWDIRYALRQFRQNPGFTAVAVLTLALGIGVNAAVFTVTNATLFKGFPLVYRNDRLLYITVN
jgi:hypothetical protein